ncbi:MAG TPA: hypothetical protein PK784_08120 [Tenuifilaceae bacterium]|nr:hypothetical protein [Tenuifilaceae bacterium]HOZ14737.1 hypothetical protein [Tenuifilaceae bacterium]HPN21472.1 hypothetical protein [Tenuifilaceae bacterium]
MVKLLGYRKLTLNERIQRIDKQLASINRIINDYLKAKENEQNAKTKSVERDVKTPTAKKQDFGVRFW